MPGIPVPPISLTLPLPQLGDRSRIDCGLLRRNNPQPIRRIPRTGRVCARWAHVSDEDPVETAVTPTCQEAYLQEQAWVILDVSAMPASPAA